MTSRAWTPFVAAASLCWLVAGCGDGGSHGNGQTITPGFFIGQTHSGEDLSIAAGSIRAVFFRCSGLIVSHRFDPPEPVAVDGSFAVDVPSGSGSGVFVVSGQIVNDDRIDGAIAGTAACDGTFVAHRCDPSSQACGDRDGDLVPDEVDPDTGPTPARTPTPAHPTATATPVCGNGILEGDEECDKKAIDDTSCAEDVCTCEDFCDDAGGTLSCNANCTVNFSKCTAGGCEF